MVHPFPLFLSLLLLLLGGCGKPQPLAPPTVGERVPEVSLVDLDGGKQSLGSFRGQVVVLHFWASWCAPCRDELPGMERLAQSLDREKFILIGVSVDEAVETVRQFKARYGIRFANHIDPDMTLAQGRFGVSAYPETFIIGRDGKLLRHMRGEHEWSSPAMRKVLNDAYAGDITQAGAYW